MKTKIIYISGNEVFEMSEIRAAFDSVRAALGLDNDTILFGVPVDSDTALTGADNVDAPMVDVVEPVVVDDVVAPESVESVAMPMVESEPTIEPVVMAEQVIEPVVEPIPEPVIESMVESTPDPVIPILSILSAGDETREPVTEPVATVVAEPVTEPVVNAIVEPEIDTADGAVISDISIDAELSTPVDSTDDVAEPVSIGDMITDDAPVPQMEKTLEQLLESMTPLREDVQPIAEVDETPIDIFETDDADATLAQLATEFADNQDKIPAAPKTSGAGKIGKLKNILPFKKAKRDDNGLMGDLFGWAGIAANDEDFSIPGFFTPAASKKQGA
ncbi:MAG: hypothetical protein E7008_01990 [Alphaproteobacteria bacterium]|nr:hypothetical protein [Alphaproteobacteria bacterium]